MFFSNHTCILATGYQESEPDARESEPEGATDGDHDNEEVQGMDEEQENGDEVPHSDEAEAWKERSHHEEEGPQDPELEELSKRLEEVTQSKSLEEMRSLHRELHARHVMGRQEALKRVSHLI